MKIQDEIQDSRAEQLNQLQLEWHFIYNGEHIIITSLGERSQVIETQWEKKV